ncbi:MAG TPA: arsenosugar biosynthesis radical SAM (seleno)protein ArsS [Longimicrobiales bacterium]|nr:arsenosugar biosynthesis radical SAM (seleno)protein ArsS [Longimicrobiales bacterium]
MSRILPTLQRRADPLAAARAQRELLARVPVARSFDEALRAADLFPLRATGIEILQLNVGKRCNQTCRHCHVDAGPERQEVMSREVLEATLRFLELARIPVLDITGGAPELHPDFREIVVRARAAGAHVMHRCNLTAILLPNYSDIPQLLAQHQVEIIASLPYYQARETDTQRGAGVFEESLQALRLLNALGYGRGHGLRLNLVMNPVGTFLPGSQPQLEALWKRELKRRYDVVFDKLFTITNMPISRFLEFLEQRGRTEEYLNTLVNAFNAAAARGVMCRNTLSVGWDGALYDCDFNQMLELPVNHGAPARIEEASLEALQFRVIEVGPHCFGCTAGGGSSCGGALAQ